MHLRISLLITSIVCLSALGVSPRADAQSPTTPDGFRYEIYSDTTAELFWSRTINVPVQGYEISRNDVVLGIFDSLSYVDNTLSPGITYQYGITAIDFDGDRSPQSTVTLITPATADAIAKLQNTISSLETEIEQLTVQLNSDVRSPVPQTGQTQSVLFGDDGDFQSGISWPDPRFTVNVEAAEDQNANGFCDDNENCNGTVRDNLTGLIWLQNANCFGGRNWAEAINDANTLTGDNTSNCGLSDQSQAGDWRLANIKEMQSLLDYQNDFPTPLLPENHPFTDVQVGGVNGPPSEYWTSTSTGSDGGGVYSISVSVGWVSRISTGSDAFSYFVWPVRGGL